MRRYRRCHSEDGNPIGVSAPNGILPRWADAVCISRTDTEMDMYGIIDEMEIDEDGVKALF